MDCSLTQDYTLDSQDFYGGITTVYLIEKAHVSITNIGACVISITKKYGSIFRKYELEAHTGDGKELKVVNQTNKTASVKQQIMFPVNGMSLSVRNEIEKLAKNRLLIILIDNNGDALLYGKDFGMRLLNVGGDSGKTLSDRNGYDLTFESDEKREALYVNSDLVNSLQTPEGTTYFFINGSNLRINSNSFLIN